MSKTFTSRPAVQNRGRGRGRGTTTSTRSRGRGTALDVPSDMSESDTNRINRSQVHHTFNSNMNSGRGQGFNNNYHNQYDRATGNHATRSRPTNHLRAGYGGNPYQDEHDDVQDEASSNTPQQNTDPTRGQYTGAYTVFQPNERKRAQVSAMAQREAQQYQQYKQATAIRQVNFVGRAGGSDMTEEQVRLRQAKAVRDQKLNRLQRQEAQREETKRAEEKVIEEKRAEARRKAEQNAIREQSRIAQPEDVRRKREAFLNRLEQGRPAP
ncbi:unnamed protein product [Lymnaea stagnalis]|uniref:Uncharacterized protein n=1 Tax=Lymnaea stagnalis TaxID=6523 RepID=A0AAV2HBX4_LYMST